MSLRAILAEIDREHAQRVKDAERDYNAQVQPALEEYRRVQKTASDKQNAALAAANQWRDQAVKACCGDGPIRASDIKKATRYVGEERKPVSVAHVSCLEGRA